MQEDNNFKGILIVYKVWSLPGIDEALPQNRKKARKKGEC